MREGVKMIEFKPISLEWKNLYEQNRVDGAERGCDYTFANLYLWGRQRAAIIREQFVVFSQFDRRSMYLYPMGAGEKKPVLDAIIADSKERGITCRIYSITAEEKQILEDLYPGMFRFHCDRDTFDYVYAIDDLADLKGRKFQRKRNHLHRFYEEVPGYRAEPLNEENLPLVRQMVEQWYAVKQQENPEADYHFERTALLKALRDYQKLGMEGLVLLDGETVLAVTLGSMASAQTFDVHFEKARWDMDGAYAAINCAFAQYIRGKYPDIRFLNREDDMGMEGLRKAKLSYHPHHMIEKYWACLLEDGYDY